MTLIADFLTGSLLTLLLPVFLLLALVAWYMLVLRRVPEPADGKDAAATSGEPASAAEATPAPSVAVSEEANRPPDA